MPKTEAPSRGNGHDDHPAGSRSRDRLRHDAAGRPHRIHLNRREFAHGSRCAVIGTWLVFRRMPKTSPGKLRYPARTSFCSATDCGPPFTNMTALIPKARFEMSPCSGCVRFAIGMTAPCSHRYQSPPPTLRVVPNPRLAQFARLTRSAFILGRSSPSLAASASPHQSPSH